MEGLISVIIPLYNVESLLGRCVDMVLGQSYPNLEVILVDDGATDGSGAICDEYAGRDKRVRVIHKKNGGVSSARNAALEVATGEYVAFIDSDDMVHPQMLERLLAAMEETGAGIAMCNYIEFDDWQPEDFLRLPQNAPLTICRSSNAAMRGLYAEESTVYTVVWNKLYRRELIGGLRFPEGRLHEDEYVTYRLLYAAGTIAHVRLALYAYYQRADSIMGKQYRTSRLDVLGAYEERCAFFMERACGELYGLSAQHCLAEIAIGYYRAKEAGLPADVGKGLKRRYACAYKSHARALCLKKRIVMRIFTISPWLFDLLPGRLRYKLV